MYHTPVAPRVPSVRKLHGETVVDDYAWMRDPNDPTFREYLAAERAYYEAHSRHLDRLVEQLAAEATGRIPSGDEYSVAWPVGRFTYRTRMPEGSDYLQLLRSQGEDSAEQLLLDENLLAAETRFADIGVRVPSPDGRLLAWSVDRSGGEIYELRIRDLETGEDLPEVIARSYTGAAWSLAADNLFYLVPDALNRPFQVWRHAVGTSAAADVLVLEETDERFELTLDGSRSRELAIITAA